MTEQTKRCPYCEGEVSLTAKKCRFCGEWLEEKPATGQSSIQNPETLLRQALGDKYEIQGVLGKGGMATVYKAVQKNLNRTVALKVIHQNLVHDTEFVSRFIREAQVSASLNHPNIVTVHDVGSIGSVHYMAMELLEGADLHQMVKQKGALHHNNVVKWMIPVADALDYIHQKGLLHRDIKSSNILITREGRPVLMDFGIAHAADGTKLTQTGTVIGTPEYMSPEQAQGHEVDNRSDLYSLGVVMYECLTGKVPFKGDNPLTTIHKVIYDEPKSIVQHNYNLPNWLESIILKLLVKNPKQRFVSGKTLASALNQKEMVVNPFQNANKNQSAKTQIIDSAIENNENDNSAPNNIEEKQIFNTSTDSERIEYTNKYSREHNSENQSSKGTKEQLESSNGINNYFNLVNAGWSFLFSIIRNLALVGLITFASFNLDSFNSFWGFKWNDIIWWIADIGIIAIYWYTNSKENLFKVVSKPLWNGLILTSLELIFFLLILAFYESKLGLWGSIIISFIPFLVLKWLIFILKLHFFGIKSFNNEEKYSPVSFSQEKSNNIEWIKWVIGLVAVFVIIGINPIQILQNRWQRPIVNRKAQILNQQPQNLIENLQMVFVQGGTFKMGSESEYERLHSVTLSDFYIGKHEVTQAQWVAIMEDNPARYIGYDYPVERVDWNTIQEFIRKLNKKTGKNYRLPTEAEWEFAAKGGMDSQGYKYAGSNSPNKVAWFNCQHIHPVGKKLPNELGLYDMSGNVSEFCNDWYCSEYYSKSPTINPQGPSLGDAKSSFGPAHIIRGGNYYYERVSSVTSRSQVGENVGIYGSAGFRLAHDYPIK